MHEVVWPWVLRVTAYLRIWSSCIRGHDTSGTKLPLWDPQWSCRSLSQSHQNNDRTWTANSTLIKNNKLTWCCCFDGTFAHFHTSGILRCHTQSVVQMQSSSIVWYLLMQTYQSWNDWCWTQHLFLKQFQQPSNKFFHNRLLYPHFVDIILEMLCCIEEVACGAV